MSKGRFELYKHNNIMVFGKKQTIKPANDDNIFNLSWLELDIQMAGRG